MAAAAVVRGAAAISVDAARAAVARYAESGVELGADQAAALIGVLTSGARVEVLAAPAGTGKSFVVGALAEVWAEHGHRVVGIAPSQVAASRLAEEGMTAANIDRWLSAQTRLAAGRPVGDDDDLRIRAGDIVVVDEAGMASTQQLQAIRRRVEGGGGKLLLVGDPRQLGAVGPGGTLADLTERGVHYELVEVRRFTEEWERDASLRLRDGDVSVLGEYEKHGRIIDGGTAEQAEAAAQRAWLADTLAGKESLLLVGSNEAAARVSGVLRAELVTLGLVEEAGVILSRDGTTAGVGDVVQARHNGWDQLGHEGNTQAPINRSTYRVVGVREDGGLTVTTAGHGMDGVTIELTAAYVAEHLTLGYASTVHAGQGRTVDTSHAVVGADTDAAGLLVPMTRGRDSNIAYVVTQAVAADLPTGAATEVEPRVARAVLADVLERGGHDVSAQQQIVEAETEHRSTWRNVGELVEGVVVATAGATSATLDRLAEAGTLTEAQRRDLAADDSMGAVERILRAAELAGHDRDQVLTEALEDRSLVGARSTGQVLYHRIQAKVEKSLAPHVESFHDLIPANAAERVRPWLEERAERADDRRRELGEHIADTAPAWAIDALGPVPEEILSRAVWEHKAGWAAAYRELAGHEDERDALGAAPSTGLAEKHAVWRTAHQALELPDARADEREMTDGQLRARVAGYDRERAWAPAWVDDDLAATHQEAAKARANAAIWSAHAAADGADAETAARLREEADAERVRAAQLQEQADQLALSDEARAAWFAHTAVSLDKATRARAELETRGVDLEQPADRTTADEWVRTHAEVVGAEDAYREVDVLADDVAEHVDVLDGPVLETDVADIRDLAVEDERERADVAREADRAKLDDTAAMVARAQQALAEIEARDAAFARRAADEAHQVELARWTEEQEREEAARDESDAIWV